MTNLFVENGPVLPNDSFGSTAVTKRYFGYVNYERNYPIGTHTFAPGDELKFSIFRADHLGVPKTQQLTIGSGGTIHGSLDNVCISVELRYERSGSFGNVYDT